MASNSSRYSRRDMIHTLALGSAVCVLGDLAGNQRESMAETETGTLSRARPEELGVSPQAISAFIAAVNEKAGGLHSFMLLRRGQVAAEGWWAPYEPTHPHMLYSLSKSFTSTAIGLAVGEGHLKVDDPVLSFFPNDAPPDPSTNLRAMRVRDLLSMVTGHDQDATGPTTNAPDGNWPAAFLKLPVQHEPGTHFVYNSAATYMLSNIVQKVTGHPVLEYLTPRLFEPLGIRGATWETDPRGVNTGGWGLKVKTEDIARFGQLYLQRGKWNGKQLIPESWVNAATSKQVPNGTDPNSDWNQGYGYQFWRCRHNAFRGDGAFGQYCVVMPDQHAVVAITSGVADMQAVLNALWNHLLPGLKEGTADASGADALKQTLAGLNVPYPQGNADSPTAARVSGKAYHLADNTDKLKTLTATFRGGRCILAVQGEGGEARLVSGTGGWVRSTAPMPGGAFSTMRGETPVAGRGAWTAEDTYVAKMAYHETPYVETVTCKFAGDDVTVTRQLNVSFGPRDLPELTGHLG